MSFRAVRNSSMMVFSAVVQRAVDNEKNQTSAGARAATAEVKDQTVITLIRF